MAHISGWTPHFPSLIYKPPQHGIPKLKTQILLFLLPYKFQGYKQLQGSQLNSINVISVLISNRLSAFLLPLVVLLRLVMGNYVSCTLSTIPGNKHSRCAKVILPSGEIRQLDGPINAAELMFDNPNHFLVNSRSLQMGRRFSALNADEELEMGNVYVMFPMKRLNSIITAVDMGVLLITANSAAKRASGGKLRILPASGDGAVRVAPVSAAVNTLQGSEEPLPKLRLDEIEDFSVQEFKHRLSICKSRKPLLETITEEPLCSR